MSEAWQIAITIASPIFAAGGAYAAVRVQLAWLRRDVDDAHARIDELTQTLMKVWPMSTGKFQALLQHAHETRPRARAS
jgi:hypothetical protein